MKNLFIFIPNSLEKEKTGYIAGFYKEFEDCDAFYITETKLSKKFSKSIGYSGKTNKPNLSGESNTIFLNNATDQITVFGHRSSFLVKVIYDYKAFKNTNVVDFPENYGKHFSLLKEHFRKNGDKQNGKKSFWTRMILFFVTFLGLILKILKKFEPVLNCSATLTHFKESLKTLQWFLMESVTNKWSLKMGNVFAARLLDIFVGLFLVNYYTKHEFFIVGVIQNATQETIENLRDLLLYLMGSPIGLKLNHAFNNSLGTFFFYHISLWKVFLYGFHPLLLYYFRYLIIPGVLGLTFHLAMLSDIISLTTFHVYCIYVYAARLFNLQAKCLISLWRLFMGKKYNPLRERVDSCQYEKNQLFIGTLGFTVFLFLLPTTAMYYTVFTTFRLIIKMTDSILTRLRYTLSTLPLYVIVLWTIRSPLVAGSVYIKWLDSKEDNMVVLEAKLNKLPFATILKFVPDTNKPKTHQSGTRLLHNMFTGVLI